MDHLSYKTEFVNAQTADKKWLVVDASGATLGRLASEVAKIIRGKNKPSYTPHSDCGDNIIIINAEKVQLTGNKWDKRVYFTYSGHPGGQRLTTPRQMKAKFPERLIEHAVRGMLPKSRLGRALFGNLYVYVGANHPHEAQQPTLITL